jgi:DUF1680 family protein
MCLNGMLKKRNTNIMAMGKLSRRSFLKLAQAASIYRLPAYSQLKEQNRSRAFGVTTIREVDYADVRLTGGPLKEQFDRIYASYLALDHDRLLKVYRQRAGLPAPGEDMGGWYDADGFVPGHSLGQYISGLARFARITGDRAAYDKTRTLVRGFAATLGANHYPFASKKAEITWPCYILDKHEIGLIDAYRLAGVTEAKEILSEVIAGALPYIPDHTYDRGPNSPKQAPYDEPYILPENLFRSYEVTGNPALFVLAQKYLLNAEYFEPLARGEDVLPGKHAYSHVIALSSAAKAYEALGREQYLQAIHNAWDLLETTQRYASGGWGPKETFVQPHQGELAKSITSTHDHFETPCGCYAQCKLARYLLRFTGDARYGDGLERVLYNTLLGAKDPDGEGRFFYYSDYYPDTVKTYYHAKWPCCSGTLVQGVADYAVNVYFLSAQGIYVNLFTPSEIKWRQNGIPVKLVQTTNYPSDGNIELRLSIPIPLSFTIFVRIPGWLTEPARIRVNSKPFDVPAEPLTFAAIQRTWHNHDTLEVVFPLTARIEPIDDRDPHLVAVMRGPLMLVAINATANLMSRQLRLPETLIPSNGGRLKYKHDGLEFELAPFYQVGEESYTTYLQM